MGMIYRPLNESEITLLQQQGCQANVAGMLVPGDILHSMLEELKNGKTTSIDKLGRELKTIHEQYDEASWSWCIQLIQSQLQKRIEDITAQDFIKIILDWKENSLKLNNMILNDATKEFDVVSRIGFGINGDELIRDADFAAVRGTYEKNKFVLEIKEEIAAIESRAETWTARIQNLS